MSTTDHAIAWHWCTQKTTTAYKQLLRTIQLPLIITLDGGRGTYSAITSCWPTTKIQRCTVHTQRRIRRLTTSTPHTEAGKALYAPSRTLTGIETQEQAVTWIINLHNFGKLYHDPLNEKTLL